MAANQGFSWRGALTDTMHMGFTHTGVAATVYLACMPYMLPIKALRSKMFKTVLLY
jgi:hypothetical protein